MSSPARSPSGVIAIVAIALCVGWLALVPLVFAARMGFPLELEWMEGGVLHQALRLQQGEPIYPPPGAQFIPFLYTPVYPTVLAGLGFVVPLDYALGRAVSIAAWFAVAGGLWRAVAREGKPTSHRFIAVGLFAASYVFTFRWFDLARPDATFMAATVWALVLLRESWGHSKKAVAAGLLMGLAFWTKQTAGVFVIASAFGAVVVAPRQAWIYGLVVAGTIGGGLLVGNDLTDGWLWTYVYELHQSHAFNRERFTHKTWGMFAHAMPFLVVLLGFLAVRGLGPWFRRRRRFDARQDQAARNRLRAARGLVFWGAMAATGLLVSALGYSTQWAEPNAFIPGATMVALFVAVALPARGWAQTVGLWLCAMQLLFAAALEPMYQPIQDHGWAGLKGSYRWQDPTRSLPDLEQVHRAARLRDEIEATQGEMLALSRPWWSVLAGGRGHVGSMGLSDVGEDDRRAVARELGLRVKRQEFSVIWLEGEPPRWLRAFLGGYRVERRLHAGERVRPLSGYMSEPGMVTPYREDQLKLIPVSPRAPPRGGRVIADFEDGTLQGFTVDGEAFGRRPLRSMAGRLPPAGPHGGEFLLASAGAGGRVRDEGVAMSAPFMLPRNGYLEVLLGSSGPGEGLSATLITDDGRTVALPIPPGPHVLSSVRFTVDPSWAEVSVSLRLTDRSRDAAVYVDDLWVVDTPAAGPPAE